MGRLVTTPRSSLCLRLVVVLATTMAWFALGSGAAHADNTLATTNPADGSTLEASPTSLLLTFVEPLGPNNTVLTSCNGSPFSVGSPSVSADGLSLTVAVPNPMPKGTCNVSATVSAVDSTPNGTVSFSFSITNDPAVAATTETTLAPLDPNATTVPDTVAPAATTSDGEPAEPPRVGGPLALSRLLATLGLGVLLGSLVLIVVAWPEGVEYILTVRFLRTAWIVGLLGSIGMVVFLRAQTTGESVGSSLSPLSWTDLADSGPGLAALVRVAFAAACGWIVVRPERCIDQATQLPAMVIPVIAVATFGFSRSGGDLAIIGMAVGVLHSLAMAVWLGGLVLLTRVVLAGPGEEDLVHAVRGFDRISTPALLVTIATGAVMTYRLDAGELFSSSHGRVLILKALVTAAIVFVGLATKQFIKARVARTDVMTVPLAARMRRATGVEAAGGVLVLLLTSWLLSMTPPGLVEDDANLDQYGYTQGRIVDGDLELTVYLTSTVGPNGVRIEVAQPEEGLSNLVVRFVPPIDSGAAEVVLTVPPELDGTGAAVLDVSEGVPLDAPGVWTLVVTATTPTGDHTGQKTFTLLG
jgi:copper transport protein